MGSYERLKKEAEDFYSQLKPVSCPALQNERVVFSRSGFNHLLRKNGVFRTKEDQLRRFFLLRNAPKILQDPDATVTFRVGQKAVFWKVSKVSNGRLIRVIVRKIKEGKPHFFSIMENKI